MKPFEKTPVWYFKNTFSSPCTWSKDEVTCSAPRHHGHLQRAFWLHYFQFKDDLVQFKTQTSQAPSCAFTPRLQHEFNPCYSSWWSKLSHFLWVCHLSFASLLLWPTLPRGVRKECEEAVGRHATKHHRSRGESFCPTLYGFFWLTFYLRDGFIRWDRRRIIWSIHTNNYTITPMKIFHYVQTTHEVWKAKDRWLYICISPHINVTCACWHAKNLNKY